MRLRQKKEARRACERYDPVAMFDCVYGAVETSGETAGSEQDLTAQQREVLGEYARVWGYLLSSDRNLKWDSTMCERLCGQHFTQ